ncbi:hypothetical protein DTL21_08960 [Bremerella cremea]|uniref:DUF4345 domain-containing protein n=1 Tax=Blastopirellula marina TaxID=124 RepID=A0A2S8FV39_9BACT|nr:MULTISPECIES: hypothetical protein [Pirellulaceae]PQO36045.1 hypothetical protein C5Y83_08955 [Blastopirellula marina]RCS48722.1 hypothetical protein DTL21_08960 [Bremerella cremea]
MQAIRFFLAFVGLCYLTLGVWCAAAPSQTSNSVGFDLQKGSGQSEFFTVYGGVEFAWGLIFLMPLLWGEFSKPLLIACVLIHGMSVVFRAISLFLFTGMGTTTYVLAGVEWAIFLISAGLLAYMGTLREAT